MKNFHIPNKNRKVSVTRRTLLRQSTLTGASLIASQAFVSRALGQTSCSNKPKRLLIWYWPEGAAQQAFWPGSGPGALDINMGATVGFGGGATPASRGDSISQYRSSEMGTYCLQPLKAHEKDITLISGFRNDGPGHSDPHQTVVQSALTGGNPNGNSLDQHLGPILQGSSPYSSIISSCYGEHTRQGISTAYTCPIRINGGAANLSWNPVTTYKQIFPDGINSTLTGGPNHALESRANILSAVASRLEAVKCLGGIEAQLRMESYLESFEKIERTTESLLAEQSGGQPIDVSVDMNSDWLNINNNNKYWHNKDNFVKMQQIQMDTAVAAFALDRTRVSFMQTSASGIWQGISGDHYKTAGIRTEGAVQDHHLGHENNGDRRRDQARVFRWAYSQLDYLIRRLKEVPDSDGGSLFDNTLILTASEFGMYNHRHNDLPYMLIGNPCGNLKKGVYLDAYRNGHRKHNDLLLGVCRLMGYEGDFGNSDTPYTDMFT